MLRRIPGRAAEVDARVDPGAAPFLPRTIGRSTVASWMTRQDRELLIGDNVAYVDAAIAAVAGGRAIERLVFCGFSQGVAMAFRAGAAAARARPTPCWRSAATCRRSCWPMPARTFPRVLLARGTRDEWYTAAKLLADEAALQARGAAVETLTFDGAHEWHADFATRAARACAELPIPA